MHEQNEDAWRILEASEAVVRRRRRGVLFAVCDGVSSSDQGRMAAQVTCERVGKFVTEGEGEPQVATLARQVMDLDGELRQQGRGRAACTLSSLWLFRGAAHLVHVGNSEAFLLRGTKLKRLTPDPGTGSRRLLRTFVGMGGVEHELVVQSFPFARGDLFLLFTDGVTEGFNNDYVSLIRPWFDSGGDPQRYVDGVMALLSARAVEDDATLVAAHVRGVESMRVQMMAPG